MVSRGIQEGRLSFAKDVSLWRYLPVLEINAREEKLEILKGPHILCNQTIIPSIADITTKSSTQTAEL